MIIAYVCQLRESGLPRDMSDATSCISMDVTTSWRNAIDLTVAHSPSNWYGNQNYRPENKTPWKNIWQKKEEPLLCITHRPRIGNNRINAGVMILKLLSGYHLITVFFFCKSVGQQHIAMWLAGSNRSVWSDRLMEWIDTCFCTFLHWNCSKILFFSVLTQ